MMQRISSPTRRWLLLAAVVLAGLAGCDTVHAWGRGSNRSPGVFGANVSVPLGK